ncbi:hypothetical protein Ddye_019992 [Dipteronia dyeriana]|uniref:Reverse transcriptase zinc-binding domain-containing protein n=1 Tax=Dipteronia dyeriana TaxID=168575 RepID=A0AAD9TZ42_9ROSI|nr:hypothetical protein Ddye_019992 [Dipteronia dyeriana]
MNLVRKVWIIPFIGRPPQVAIGKLKNIKKTLKSCNWKVFDDLNSDISKKSTELRFVYSQMFYMDLVSFDSAHIDEVISIVDDFVPSLISQEENSLLVVIPSADVIHDAVFAMDALSSPRPDGFNGHFFQCCWVIVGRDMILVIQDYFHSGVVAPGLNSNFIVLLPKMKDSIMVDQFRPIVLDKTLSKFSKWKGKSLSLAGRATLIRSVINVSFFHSFMVYKWSVFLTKMVTKKIINFLWTGSYDECKLVRVAWNRCCRPYAHGGLGLKDLTLLNDSLLRKLTWKLITLNNFAFTFFTREDGIWLIGEDSKKDFWRDNWLGVPILDLLEIPDFLATHLQDRVSDFIRDGKWILDDHFRARFSDLYFWIDRIGISSVTDYLVWSHARDGIVSCKAAYSRMFHDIPQVPWWRYVWSRYIPPSRSVLTWQFLLDRLPTDDRLYMSGFHLTSRCSVCRASSESMDHLFPKCPLATTFWEAVFSAFQRYVSADTWGSFFKQTMSVSFSAQLRILWRDVIHAVVWSVWYSRNQWIFEGKYADFRAALSLV